MFVFASLICAGVLPQELWHLFYSHCKLGLSSGIAFGKDCQMTGCQQGLDLGLKFELCCLTIELVKVLSSLKSLNKKAHNKTALYFEDD